MERNILTIHNDYAATMCAAIDMDDPTQKAKAKQIISDLQDTLKASETGVGIAAPQIGENYRIFIFTLNNGKKIPLINPHILGFVHNKTSLVEGCLSCPGEQVQVFRHEIIHAAGTLLTGQEKGFRLRGLEAKIFQHELDHLNGKLIVDYK